MAFVHFPVAGIDAPVWLPPLVAFCISVVTSPAGISGAVLLLPFQMSVLGFTSPSVSATNQWYNVVAIPAGVMRLRKEGRLPWPLVVAILAGLLPGIVLGALTRSYLLVEPAHFKLLVAGVLVFLCVRLILGLRAPAARRPGAGNGKVERIGWSIRSVRFRYLGKDYSIKNLALIMPSLLVGVVSGAYGIGGGGIIAPYLVAVLAIPIHVVAGVALFCTMSASVLGVASYVAISMLDQSRAVSPDWYLGLLFGLGGMAGIYTGARLQRYLPARLIRVVMLLLVLFAAGRYLWSALASL